MLKNVLGHPKTSIAGVLICIVTVAGVLSQQGITLGNAGTGTWVALIAALATAFLGLLATDPGSASTTSANNMTKKLPVWLFCAALLGFSFTLTGCPAKQTIGDLVNILGTASSNIANLEGNTALAQKLTVDTAAAVIAVDNWKSGSPATEAIEALNIVEADLNLIPGTGPYAPLIVLAIGTVESILDLLPQPATAMPSAEASAKPRVNLSNPPKTKAQFKEQWNSIAKMVDARAVIQ